MRLIHINSPTIQAVGYDLDAESLCIQFYNGSTHEYYGISPLLYAELMSADDQEAYYRRHIKDDYPHDKVMKSVRVESRSLHNVGYNPRTQTLFITFNSGATYEYDSVPPEVYAGLMNAASQGAYLNQHIRNHYAYKQRWLQRFHPAP